MELHEAIQHCLEVASGATAQGACPECAEDHKQLADWLDELAAYRATMPLVRARELAQAEWDGYLVVLPCKAGDTIYQLRKPTHARGAGISPRIVSCVEVWGQDYAVCHQGMEPCLKRDFGKTWFLTRQEAEAALSQKEV